MKINTIRPDQSEFLRGISHIAKVPEKLYFMGNIPADRRPTVAIVGTRRPTSYGTDTALRFSRALAERGIVIISGLAIGVDSLAHRGALEAGGTTIGVLPGGLDYLYPRSNHSLAMQMVQQGGALISEYPEGYRPYQHSFLERNRLESAVSDAIVVIEAAQRSGTLNTVMHGLEQGKTIYAVPGNITSPMSAGCNHLIQQGAIPLTDPQQVLDQLGMSREQAQTNLLGDNEDETTLIVLIKKGVQDGDELLVRSKLAPDDFSRTLTMLELKGTIRSLGANLWRLH